MILRLTTAGAFLSALGYYVLILAGVEPTLVHQEEARSYQLLLGALTGLVSLGIGLFCWWAKSIMAKATKIEEQAIKGNEVVVSMLREIAGVKVTQEFTTEAIRELKAAVSKLSEAVSTCRTTRDASCAP